MTAVQQCLAEGGPPVLQCGACSCILLPIVSIEHLMAFCLFEVSRRFIVRVL